MRALTFVFFLLLGAAIVVVWWVKFEHEEPVVTIRPDDAVIGARPVWHLDVDASGTPGLRRLEIWMNSGGQTYEVFRKDFPADAWYGGHVHQGRFEVAPDLVERGIREGPWRLEVVVDTYAWSLLPRRRRVAAARTVNVDLTPPSVQLLTTQHNIRLGGSALALFRVDDDTASSGIAVADYFFPAQTGYFIDDHIAAAVFAVSQELSPAVQPRVRVTDSVGNAWSVDLPCRIRPRSFRERSLEIGDGFLRRKMPEIYAAIGEPLPDDLVQAYLHVNGDLRKRSEEKIRELTAASVPEPLWDGAFRRQSNSAPMSAFADRRVYLYDGEPIDRQTHLGFDLASVRRAPVEATQNGIVVLADYLGIYGNTVILDHGFGVFSLYGHLSTFSVKEGDRVEAGQTLGQTGETGLAGGDHLHFSIMVHGVHVDPIEWWDGKWIHDHVTDKLAMFPAREKERKAAETTAEERESAREEANGEARP